MSYRSNIPHEYLYPDGPPTPEEIEEAYAESAGYRDGYNGSIGEEGKVYLAGKEFVRRAYINRYKDGFMHRKLDAGEIALDEFYFYDPFPGRWGTYWQEV